MMKKRISILMMLFCLMGITGCNDDSDSDHSPAAKGISWKVIATPVMATDGEEAQTAVGNPLVEFLSDGSMLIVEGSDGSSIEVAKETTPGSRVFKVETVIAGTGGWNTASWVAVANDDEILVGTSDKIYRVALDTKTSTPIAECNSYDAVLAGDMLYFSGSAGSEACLKSMDISASNPGLTITDIVTGIPGSSGGVCLDKKGNIYTGIGYDKNDVTTGLIRSFPLSGAPHQWKDGADTGDVLSAGSLTWIGEGTMLVGGGDVMGSSGDCDYFTALNTATGNKLWERDPDTAGEKSSYALSAYETTNSFAASIWDWTGGAGKIYFAPLSALSL